MATVLRLDPRDKHHGYLLPMAVERIAATGEELHDPDARRFAESIAAKLYVGDPSVCLLAIVEEETASLIGHVLGLAMMDGGRPVVMVSQRTLDKKAGDALNQATEAAILWGLALKPKMLTVFDKTGKSDWKEIAKRFGLKPYRHLLWLPLNGNAHPAGGDSGDRGDRP